MLRIEFNKPVSSDKFLWNDLEFLYIVKFRETKYFFIASMPF